MHVSLCQGVSNLVHFGLLSVGWALSGSALRSGPARRGIVPFVFCPVLFCLIQFDRCGLVYFGPARPSCLWFDLVSSASSQVVGELGSTGTNRMLVWFMLLIAWRSCGWPQSIGIAMIDVSSPFSALCQTHAEPFIVPPEH